MKTKHFGILAAGAALSVTVLAADVGVSISVGEPGFYGRLDLGGFPPPALVYRQPVVVAPTVAPEPVVYLRVPPGHRKHWSRHCQNYGACGQRVYFVRDDWYAREYVPRYRERYMEHAGRGHYVERRDRDERWDDRGHSEGGAPPPWAGNGRGHGRGRD